MNTEVKPILVLGEARRNDLAARMKARFGVWLETWGGIRLPDGVAVAFVDDAEAIVERAQYDRSVVASANGVAHLLIVAASDSWSDVLGLHGRSSLVMSGKSIVANNVYDEMLRSLAQDLTSAAQLGSWEYEKQDMRASHADERFVGAGWYGASIGTETKEDSFQILLSSSLVMQLAPRSIKGLTAGIARRRAAVADESIRVEAVLGEATVSIGDLSSLAVNDVIMLRDDAPNACYLRTETGKPVATVSLGRVGSKRAALITGNRT